MVFGFDLEDDDFDFGEEVVGEFVWVFFVVDMVGEVLFEFFEEFVVEVCFDEIEVVFGLMDELDVMVVGDDVFVDVDDVDEEEIFVGVWLMVSLFFGEGVFFDVFEL